MSALLKSRMFGPMRLASEWGTPTPIAEPSTEASPDKMQLRRFYQELEAAACVQRDLLPLDPPVVPPFQMAAHWQPCSAVGGDYYDFIPMGDRLGIAVGDVAGKGIAAALLMASLRASLRAQIETGDDVGTIVSRVNARLVRDTRHGAFATLFFGVLDSRSLEFEYCSAGHEPGLVVDRHGDCSVLETGGLPLGIDDAESYHTESVRLDGGDLLAIYTDGITEASNAAGAMFGRWPARATLKLLHEHPVDQICSRMMADIQKFTGSVEQMDDTTMVLVSVDESRN